MTVGRRTLALGILVAALAAAAAALFGGSASNADTGRQYLALGDSVAFGYIAGAGPEYRNATNFDGYPYDVGDALGLTAVDAACPGETTGSFIDTANPDNGCQAFRSLFPLHVQYGGSQLAFATDFLRSHRSTRLVTVQLGANDAFRLQASCGNDPACIAAGFPALAASVAANVDAILRAVRGAGFHGKLIVVNYYSLDYSDASGTALTAALNAAITSSAAADGATVADAFSALAQATGGGNTCLAGLLNPNPNPAGAASAPPACDVHPSRSGQLLLAQAVEAAYHAG